MATTTEIAKPPIDEGFDPFAFWILHRTKILLLLVVLLIGLIVFGVSEWSRQRTEAAAHAAFAAAAKPEDFQKVMADFPKQPAAASAALRLAESLRQAGKYDEANAVLKSFTEQHADHPLIAGAYTSMGANDEDAGKLDQALADYKRVIASYPTAFCAPAAWIGQARVLQQQGKTEEARHVYETVITQFPESPFTSEAFRASQKLKK